MRPLKPLIGFLKDSWKHPKIRRAGWTALAAAGVDLLVLAFFWIPAAWGHHQMEQAIEGERHARIQAAQAAETAQAYDQLSRRAALLEAKWRTPVTQAGLVESLTQSAARHRLKVLSQDFDVKNLPDGGTAFEQNFSVSGDYPSLRRFLDGLENLPTLTVVRQARLEREGPVGSRVRAVLGLWTYQKKLGGA